MEPGWNGYDSPSKQSLNEPAVYFFPRTGGKYNFHQQNPDEEGWVVPKLFKRQQPTKRERKQHRKKTKREWRRMSNRMQDEQRFRRYPRDDSGKVMMGQFRKQMDPKNDPNR